MPSTTMNQAQYDQLVSIQIASQGVPSAPPLTVVPVDPEKLKPEEKQLELPDPTPKNCPKCGAFVERVLIATHEHLPGVYCNKEGCGWSQGLHIAVEKVDSWDYILSATVISMVKAAPMNEEVRAQVHATMLQQVPRSCSTAEDIQQWVETAAPDKFKPMPKPTIPPRLPGLYCEVEYSYQDRGTANYSCRCSGSQECEVQHEDLVRAAEEADSLSELKRMVVDILVSESQDNPPETEAGRYEYDNHESGDTEDDQHDVNTSHLDISLETWMRIHRPEDWERLTRP